MSIATKLHFLGGRTLVTLQKHSPTILTVVGVVAGLASTGFAVKGTLNVTPDVYDLQKDVEQFKQRRSAGDYVGNETQYGKDLAHAYFKGVKAIGRHYVPAASLAVISVSSIISAHGIMRERNAALALAYAGLQKGFLEYRNKVAERIGDDQERELCYDVEKTVKEKDANGKAIEVAQYGDRRFSPYARFFDELNPNWVRQNEHNRMFISVQQKYANDLLQARGHLFLNEVYDLLGMDRSSAGQIVGWVKGNGDDFVDFGMYRDDSDEIRSFVNGVNKSVLLDFNVDGPVYNLI